jgi:hypothetical protein
MGGPGPGQVDAATAAFPDAGCGQPGAGQLVNIEPESITVHAVHLCPLIDALRAAGPAFP